MLSFKLVYKLFLSLSNRRRFQCISFLALSLCSASLQFFLLLTFYPLIRAFTNGGTLTLPLSLTKIITFLSLPLRSLPQLEIVIIFFIGLVLLSTASRIVENYYSLRLSALIGNDISNNLFSGLLSRSYLEHLSVNSSRYIHALTDDVDLVVITASESFLFIVSLATSFSVVAALFYVAPLQAILLFSFLGTSYFLVSAFSRNSILRYSYSIQSLNVERLRLIQESFLSIRDIIIHRLADYFINIYSINDLSVRSMRAVSELYSSLPRIFAEGILLLSVGIFSFFLAISDTPSSFFAFLATFALGAQRLLPSINLLYSTATSIRRYTSSLQNILSIKPPPITRSTSLSFPYTPISKPFKSLELVDVCFSYPDSSLVLSNCNLSITQGQIVGVSGPSGCGKSTLIDILMGLLPPTSGSVIVNNCNLYSPDNLYYSLNSWRSKLSHVPQSVYLLDSSVVDNVTFGFSPDAIDYELVNHVLDLVDLSDFMATLPNGISTTVGERGSQLSGGQIQRLGIARALYRMSEILILDESTSALDYMTETTILNNICNLSYSPTIIMVTHRLNTLSLADLIITVDNSRTTTESTIPPP